MYKSYSFCYRLNICVITTKCSKYVKTDKMLIFGKNGVFYVN